MKMIAMRVIDMMTEIGMVTTEIGMMIGTDMMIEIGMTTETEMTTMRERLAEQRAAIGVATTMTVSEVTGDMTIGVTRVTGPVRCTMTAGVATVSRATEMIVVTGEVIMIDTATEVVTGEVTGIPKRLRTNNPSPFFSITVNLWLFKMSHHVDVKMSMKSSVICNNSSLDLSYDLLLI